MESSMAEIQSDDPVLAVLLNELRHIREDQKSIKEEIKEDMRDLRKEVKENREFFTKEISEVKTEVGKVKEFATKWRGGYIALAGAGAVLTWIGTSIFNVLRITQ